MLLNFILSSLLLSTQFFLNLGDPLIRAYQRKSHKDDDNNEHKYKDKLCVSLLFYLFNVTVLEIYWVWYSCRTKVLLRSIVRWWTSSFIEDWSYERLRFITLASNKKIIYCVWLRFSQMFKCCIIYCYKLNLLFVSNDEL